MDFVKIGRVSAPKEAMVLHEVRHSDGTSDQVAGNYGCTPQQYGKTVRCATRHTRLSRGDRLADCVVSFTDCSYNVHRISLEQGERSYRALIPVSSSGIRWLLDGSTSELALLDEKPFLMQIELTNNGVDTGQHTVQTSIEYFARDDGAPPPRPRTVAPQALLKPLPETRAPAAEERTKVGMKRVPSAHAREGSLERAVFARLNDTDLAGRWASDTDGAPRVAYPVQ